MIPRFNRKGAIMNIYLMDEDGEQFCIKANTPKEAIDISLSAFLEDSKDDLATKGEPYNIETETKWYFDKVFLSCSLVAELKN